MVVINNRPALERIVGFIPNFRLWTFPRKGIDMHKIVFGGLAALLLSATAASAVTTINLDGFCNSYHIRKSGDGYAMKDFGCSTGFGGGYLATIKGAGKSVIIGLQDPASAGMQFVFTFSYPFVTGGTWTLEDTLDGVHFNFLVSGTYTLPTAAQRGLPGTKSATSK
jgi:hypothetical protein